MLFTCLENKTNNLQLLSNWKYKLDTYLEKRVCQIVCHTCCRASVIYGPTFLRGSMIYVTMCLRAKVLKVCQLHIFTYQRTKPQVNVLTWRANVLNSVPIFFTFLLRNAKWKCYTLLLYRIFYILLDIVAIGIICIYVINKKYILFDFFLGL